MEVGIGPELEARLTALAEKTGRGTDELLTEALGRYLDQEREFMDAVQVGLQQANRGEFVSSEEVQARVLRVLGNG